MEKVVLQYKDLEKYVDQIHFKALNIFNKSFNPIELMKREYKVFGVKRGGTFVALLLCNYSNFWQIVDTPEEADLIVDDIVDSGKTKKYYLNTFGDIPFLALIDTDYSNYEWKNKWVVFPWEKEEDGKDNSADDIPTRLLQHIGEDVKRGGLLETPKRFLKAWEYWTSGYNKNPFEVMKVFKDGAEDVDEMVVVRGIEVYSHCEHHLAAIIGTADVAYIPDGKIIGLSKLARVVDIFSRRLQVQERLTNQIADCLVEGLEPQGVGVVLKCRHLCMESRGICQSNTITVTSALRGEFKADATTRSEFLNLMR